MKRKKSKYLASLVLLQNKFKDTHYKMLLKTITVTLTLQHMHTSAHLKNNFIEKFSEFKWTHVFHVCDYMNPRYTSTVVERCHAKW